MIKDQNKFINRALGLARQMTILADEGEAACSDDGCAVLYGIIRDCAYKIRGRASKEKDLHNSIEASLER